MFYQQDVTREPRAAALCLRVHDARAKIRHERRCHAYTRVTRATLTARRFATMRAMRHALYAKRRRHAPYTHPPRYAKDDNKMLDAAINVIDARRPYAYAARIRAGARAGAEARHV